MNFEEEARKLLNKVSSQVEVRLEIPANKEYGDYAFPCFDLAKELRKNPAEIAKEIASKIKSDIFIVSSLGPYVNFKIDNKKLVSIVLSEIIKEKDNYGRQNVGKGKKLLIEHTSINPNAAPHVGSGRNALIGDAITRIYRFLGYKVDVHYYVNDVGKQIAYLVLVCKGKPRFEELIHIYIKINKKAEEDDKIEKQALMLIAKLEAGDKKVRARFNKVVSICVSGQRKILAELGIRYDKFDYESKYLWDKSVKNVLGRLEKTGKVFTDENGRKVLKQEEFESAMKMPLLVLTRGDGTTLYVLRDLAYTIDKLRKAAKNMIVLGEDQKLYFQQLSSALNLLGYKQPEIIHYSFILLDSEKMQKRQGNFVLLQDFMNELLDKARDELRKRYKKADENLAKKIAYGSLKYGILKISPEKNVNFDWQQALSFEGDSCPYIQYAHARASSILRKSLFKKGSRKTQKADLGLLRNDEEIKLVKKLSEFKDCILTYKPYVIAGYAFDVAKLFNEFYHSCQVIDKDKKLMLARLQLVKATKWVLKNSLMLLGIDAPEKM